MRQIIIITFLLLSLKGWADEDKYFETLPNHWQEVNMSGGINGNGRFELGLGYSYMFTPRIGLTGEINTMLDLSLSYDYNEYTQKSEFNYFDMRTIMFCPAVRLRTPLGRFKDAEFALNMEPGISIPIGLDEFRSPVLTDYYRTVEWLYLNLKTYITLDLCPVFLSVGYAVTDLSHQIDLFRYTHTVFIQIGLAF